MSRVKPYRESADTAERDRFVGFSFAGGDLLIEATPEGEIVFAAGASVSLLGVSISEMFGTSLASWFRDAYATILGSALKSSLDGVRKGQIYAQTRTGEQVELSMPMHSFLSISNPSKMCYAHQVGAESILNRVGDRLRKRIAAQSGVNAPGEE